MGRPRKSKKAPTRPSPEIERGPSAEELRSIEAEFNGEEEVDLTSLIKDERTSKRNPIQSFLRIYGTRKPFRGTAEIGSLIERYHGGNATERQAALREIIAGTTLLVVSMRNRMFSWSDVPTDDLLQEGVLGIQRAVDRYEPGTAAWSTYVTWWIRHHMSRVAQDTTGQDVGRVPVHMQDRMRAVDKARHRYEARHGAHPTAEELQRFMAEEAEAEGKKPLGLAKVKVSLEVTRRRATTVRVDAPLLGDDGETDANRGRTEMSSSPGQEIGLDARREYEFQRDCLKEALARLSHEEKAVLFLRCGLGRSVKRELTLQEIGDQILRTREAIRQIEVKALRKLKNTLLVDATRITPLLLVMDDAGDIPPDYDAMAELRVARHLPPRQTADVIAELDAKKKSAKEESMRALLKEKEAASAAAPDQTASTQLAASDVASSPDGGASPRATVKKVAEPPLRVPSEFRPFVRLLLLAPNHNARVQLFRDLLLAHPPLARRLIEATPEGWRHLQRLIQQVAEKILPTLSR